MTTKFPFPFLSRAEAAAFLDEILRLISAGEVSAKYVTGDIEVHPDRTSGGKSKIANCQYYNVPYSNADLLLDAFTGYIRFNARKRGRRNTAMQAWNNGLSQQTYRKLRDQGITAPSNLQVFETFRDLYGANNFCTEFSTLRAVQILKILISRLSAADDSALKQTLKFLDPCAGHGTRALAAIITGVKYLGFDPNTELIRGHGELIRFACNEMNNKGIKRSQNDYNIVYKPFDDMSVYDIEQLLGGKADFAFTSPPFFDLEDYSKAEGDSFTRYPSYIIWRENFMFVLVQTVMRCLRKGGIFALHTSNIGNYNILNDTIDYITGVWHYEVIWLTRGEVVRDKSGEKLGTAKPLLLIYA